MDRDRPDRGPVPWYAAVFVLTSGDFVRCGSCPSSAPHGPNCCGGVPARAVRAIGNRYRAGDLTAAGAGAALSGELRTFPARRGDRGAGPVHAGRCHRGQCSRAGRTDSWAELTDIQFNHRSALDAATASATAEELIRGWT